MTQLNKCPKCECTPKIGERRLRDGYYYFAYCPNLRCQSTVVTNDYRTKQEAADAWNRGIYNIEPIRTK